jgi:hypothetical protein
MENVEKLKKVQLTEHFSIGEVIKTRFATPDGNMPTPQALNNLKNICEHWLEPLREKYNQRYCEEEEGIVINQGYRSVEVMEKMIRAGYKPSPTSNHLSGCAVDIRCLGPEQVYRYGCILIDIADESRQDFDELLAEHNAKGDYWLHLAVRPKDNRRKIKFLQG